MIRLREAQDSDSPILFKWINNKELVLLNSAFSPVSEEDHQAWFDSIKKKRLDRYFFIIEEIHTSKVIGSCQLLNINSKHLNAELQIRIGESEYHGKGFGSSAVRKLLKFGFHDLKLERIYLHVFDSNIRAVKSYLKCGFKHEGLLRKAAYIGDEWKNVRLMSILKDEFLNESSM